MTESISRYVEGWDIKAAGVRDFELADYVRQGILIPRDDRGRPLKSQYLLDAEEDLRTWMYRREKVLSQEEKTPLDILADTQKDLYRQRIAELLRESARLENKPSKADSLKSPLELMVERASIAEQIQMYQSFLYEPSLPEIEAEIARIEDIVSSLADNSWKVIQDGNDDTSDELMQTLWSALYLKEDVARIKEDVRSISTTVLRMPLEEGGSDAVHDNTRKSMLPFPCPGAKWEEIQFVLKSDELVQVKTPLGDARIRFDQLGFTDGRKGDEPNKTTWPLFQVFARCDGIISRGNPIYERQTADRARLLSKHLQEVFQIEESIFTEHYRTSRRYKTRFQIRDERKS